MCDFHVLVDYRPTCNIADTLNIDQVSARKCTADYGKYTEILMRVALSADWGVLNKKKKGLRRRSWLCQSPKPSASKKEKQLTCQEMEVVMAASTKGTLSAQADLHGIPRSTLKDHLSSRVIH